MTSAVDAVREAVDALWSDVNDRRGMGFDGVDSDIRLEIRAEWTRIIGKAVQAAHRAGRREAFGEAADGAMQMRGDIYDTYDDGYNQACHDVAHKYRALAAKEGT